MINNKMIKTAKLYDKTNPIDVGMCKLTFAEECICKTVYPYESSLDSMFYMFILHQFSVWPPE